MTQTTHQTGVPNVRVRPEDPERDDRLAGEQPLPLEVQPGDGEDAEDPEDEGED